MKHAAVLFRALFLFFICSTTRLAAQVLSTGGVLPPGDKAYAPRTLPLGAAWVRERGIDLPPPFGLSAVFTTMQRDIGVTDVSVVFPGLPPQSVSDFTSFAVRNRTTVAALRLDTWILPMLNIYALAGYAYSDASVDAAVRIDPPFLSPFDFNLQGSSAVEGPYLGFGGTLAGGYKRWFILADVNYGQTWPDELDNSVSLLFVSARTGLSWKPGPRHSLRSWLGAAYLDSKSTLSVNSFSSLLNDLTVRVEQHPENPWTLQTGLMVGFNRKLDVLAEVGTNFGDAFISILSVTYRF
jgi:hypothetical protein